MINIANFLLTRKCNLHCGYCRISGDLNYKDKPKEYPNADYYYTKEQPAKFWINLIDRLVKHNPNIFTILYGGEPTLYKDLIPLVKHMKDIGANYTIISNCSMSIFEQLDQLFKQVGKIKGFTASIDPPRERYTYLDLDTYSKSDNGYKMLLRLMELDQIEDPVAEITCDVETILTAETLIKELTSKGICSDLTVLDIAKTLYYDFSSITDPRYLVPKNEEVKEVFDRLINSDYNIHMKDTLLPAIYEILPADLDCNLRINNLHNITIDADGFLRLCLRIRGVETPQYSPFDLLLPDGEPTAYRSYAERAVEMDKENLCQKCSWTCSIMSQLDYNKVLNH